MFANSFHRQIRWLAVRNTSGETVPAFGVVLVVGDGDPEIVPVAKPDAGSLRPGLLLFAGVVSIPAGELGVATEDFPARALAADSAVTVGGDYGTKADSWQLHPNETGFLAWGKDDQGTALFQVQGGSGASPCPGTSTLTLTEQQCVGGVLRTRTNTVTFDGCRFFVSSTPWS